MSNHYILLHYYMYIPLLLRSQSSKITHTIAIRKNRNAEHIFICKRCPPPYHLWRFTGDIVMGEVDGILITLLLHITIAHPPVSSWSRSLCISLLYIHRWHLDGRGGSYSHRAPPAHHYYKSNGGILMGWWIVPLIALPLHFTITYPLVTTWRVIGVPSLCAPPT